MGQQPRKGCQIHVFIGRYEEMQLQRTDSPCRNTIKIVRRVNRMTSPRPSFPEQSEVGSSQKRTGSEQMKGCEKITMSQPHLANKGIRLETSSLNLSKKKLS